MQLHHQAAPRSPLSWKKGHVNTQESIWQSPWQEDDGVGAVQRHQRENKPIGLEV
jgi:hypothetical protein